MNNTDLDSGLQHITDRVHSLADDSKGNTIELLHLLRTLEALHRQIQEGYFQASLPNSRHSLYTLLRDIEENGGWPYIERGKIQSILSMMSKEE